MISLVEKKNTDFDIINTLRPKHLTNYMNKFEIESESLHNTRGRSKS